jgi:phosphosulfolactate phosphohydrolase-like enzyme
VKVLSDTVLSLVALVVILGGALAGAILRILSPVLADDTKDVLKLGAGLSLRSRARWERRRQVGPIQALVVEVAHQGRLDDREIRRDVEIARRVE